MAARLNYPPPESDIKAVAQTWSEVISDNLKLTDVQVPKILKAFGLLALECKDWPTPSEWLERWERVVMEPIEGQQQIEDQSARPQTPEAMERAAAARARFFATVQEIKQEAEHIGQDRKSAKRLSFTGEVLRGIAQASAKED